MTLRTKLMLLGLPLILGACSEVASKEPEVRTVRTVVANPTPVADDRRAVGEVRPRYESELGFRVSGKIVTRLVDVGASVKKGDLLARLDEQDYRNKLKSAEADIVAAQAVLVEAQAAEERLAPAARRAAPPRAPTTTPRSRTCARPRRSSSSAKAASTWPGTSCAMRSCTPSSTASSRRSAPSRARSSTSAR